MALAAMSGPNAFDRRHRLVEAAHVDRHRAGGLAVVEADDAGEVRVDRRRDDMRGREFDPDRTRAQESRLDLSRVVVRDDGSVALKAEVGDPLVGRRGDVDALERRRHVDLGRRQGARVGGEQADRQAQPVSRNVQIDRALRPRVRRAEPIFDIRQSDRADRRGDDGLLRLDPLVELEAGRRQLLEQALQLRLVRGEVGARRVSSQQAPEVERLAALEAVDAETRSAPCPPGR